MPVRQKLTHLTASLSPHQVALQDELSILTGIPVVEVERFQRLLTHLSATLPTSATALGDGSDSFPPGGPPRQLAHPLLHHRAGSGVVSMAPDSPKVPATLEEPDNCSVLPWGVSLYIYICIQSTNALVQNQNLNSTLHSNRMQRTLK